MTKPVTIPNPPEATILRRRLTDAEDGVLSWSKKRYVLEEGRTG
jgi:hypothetical protein